MAKATELECGCTETTRCPKHTGRPLEMGGPIGRLAEILGGRIALAEAVGVDKRTISRWANGEMVPARPARIVLAALAKANGVEPPYETGIVCPRPAWLDEREEDVDD